MKSGKFKKFVKEAMIPVENACCPLLQELGNNLGKSL
jgi:hypothetical protein